MTTCKNLVIKYKKNTFIPTGTSDLLVESVKKKLKLKGKVLDLGAGSGYVGLKLLDLFKDKFELFASDIGRSSTQIIKSNAKINKKIFLLKLEVYLSHGKIINLILLLMTFPEFQKM